MTKKSQISIFLLLGVIIVLVTLLALGIRQSTTNAQLAGQSFRTVDFSDVETYIDSCLENAANSAWSDYTADPLYDPINPLDLNELQSGIDSKFSLCIADLSAFSVMNTSITESSSPQITITENSKDLDIIVDYPITVTKQNQKKEFRQFQARIITLP